MGLIRVTGGMGVIEGMEGIREIGRIGGMKGI